MSFTETIYSPVDDFCLISLSRACCQNAYKTLTAGIPFRDNTWGTHLERAHTQILLHVYLTSKYNVISLATKWKRSEDDEESFRKESLKRISSGK